MFTNYFTYFIQKNTFIINLNKKPSDLKFNIYKKININTNNQTQKIIRIKKIFPLKPAKSNQQIQKNDILLKINEIPIKNRTHTINSIINQKKTTSS